jgi:phosphomannomutase
MARLRAVPPTRFGDLPVATVNDLTGGTWNLPSADVLSYQMVGARVVVRPSGTEPKIKAYFEVVEPVFMSRLSEARQAAADRLGPLREAVQAVLIS